MSVTAVIAAGGVGARFGGGAPKQFLELLGVPVLRRTLDAFMSVSEISEIICAVPEGYEGFNAPNVKVIRGGVNRARTVHTALKHANCETVLVHDGARPLVTGELIQRVLNAARERGAAVAGLPETETVKKVDSNGKVIETLDREFIWRAQTPQGFSFPLLKRAYELAEERGILDEATDDAYLIEKLGLAEVYMVLGEPENIKITARKDFEYAEYILRKREG